MPLGVYTFILNFMPGKKYISILMDYDNMNYAGANGSSSNAKPNGISDTLTQGLQFQKYLKKISGFGPGPVVEQYTSMSEQEQAERVKELNLLKTEYSALVSNFEGAGNTLRSGYGSYLTVSGYPADIYYTNKHVTFDGKNGYVTKHGVFKSYDGSGNQFDNVNGCPSTSDRKIFDGTTLSAYGLRPGTPMYDGQPCGDEGTNVLVTRHGEVGITYSGCYAANDTAFSSSSLTFAKSNLNVDSCRKIAVDTGAAVFALKNVHATLNNGDCYTGATFVSPTLLGDAYVGKTLWTSEDTPKLSGGFLLPYKMQLKNGGFISIIDSSSPPQLVKQIKDNRTSACQIIPRVTKFYETSTTSPVNLIATTEDALNTLNENINPSKVPSFSFQISAIYPDVSTSFKNYTLVYTCGVGGAEIKKEINGGHEYRFVISCENNTSDCVDYYLTLTDDGKMEVYKGLTPTSTETTQLNSQPYANKITYSVLNPSYPLTGSKTGSNNISSGLFLLQNEYITSSNGKLVLIMQPDGHLVLKTFTQPNKCSTREPDKQSYGGADSYALYNFTSPMDNSNIGKLAYIDEDGFSHVYPSSMIMYDQESKYQRHMGYDSVGNNLGIMPIENSSDAYCKTASSANVNSGGYVYDSINKTCYIKNNNLKLSTPKTYAEGKYLNIKLPVPNVPISCSDTLTEIDSTRWAKYRTDVDVVMSNKFTCDAARRFSREQQIVRTTEKDIYIKALYIISKMNELQAHGTILSADMVAFKTQLQNSIDAYNNSISTTTTTDDNTINSALSGMMSDVDLMVLQENTRYLFLSIFAVGVMVVALNAIKK